MPGVLGSAPEVGRARKRDDVGAHLVLPDEIQPAAVDEREVGGNDEFFRPHAPAVGDCGCALQFPDEGMGIVAQTPRDCMQESERVELRHIGVGDGVNGGEGEVRGGGIGGGEADRMQEVGFLFQVIPTGTGVHDRRAGFEVAVDIFCEAADMRQPLKVGVQVIRGGVPAVGFGEFTIQLVMLGGEDGGCSFCDACSRQSCVEQDAIRAARGKFLGDEDSRDAAADNADVCGDIGIEGMFRQWCQVVCPQKSHRHSPFSPIMRT